MAAPQPYGDYYPPAIAGLRGSHDGAFESAHQLAREGRTDFGAASQPDGSYDLIVVGAGIAGLAAAHFARLRDPSTRVLLLDNHDDFGGHAKRNEFEIGGRTFLAHGGSQSLDQPSKYSDVSKRLLRSLSVDIENLERAYHTGFYANHGLTSAIFFNRESFGEDRLVRGYEHLIDVDLFFPLARDGRSADQVVREMPLTPSARSELLNILSSNTDMLPDQGIFSEPDYLSTISYQHFLSEHLSVSSPQTLALLRHVTSFLGDSIETTTAMDALLLGLPGLGGTSMRPLRDVGRRALHGLRDPYTYHFPDGNATIARLLVRRLIPAAAGGSTMADIVSARFDYSKLDEAQSPVRLRLSSTVLNVEHDGPMASARSITVTYIRAGRVERVRAKHCVLACWATVVPHICQELPEDQRSVLATFVKTPLVYTNVMLRNWRAWKNLGIGLAYCPGSWHTLAMLDFPVSIGEYGFARGPDDPIVAHMQKTPLGPGNDRRNAFREGRAELLATEFESIERSVREQLARLLSEGGFEPARDIIGITVNRWPHGYSWAPSMLDQEEPRDPFDLARRRHGRIALANADMAGRAYVDAAIDQAWLAISELDA